MSDRREINRIRLDSPSADHACIADTPDGPLVFGGRNDGGPWTWDPRGTDWQARDLVHEGFDQHLVDYMSEWDLLYTNGFVWHGGRPLLLAGSRHDDPYEHVHEDGDDCVDWEDEELEMPVGASVRLYDLSTGRKLHGPPAAHEWHVWSIAALSTPDGLLGLSGGGDGCQTAVAWDLETGTAIGKLEGHHDGIASVALALDGDRAIAVTGSPDSTVRAWNTRTAEAIGEAWTLPGAVGAVALAAVGGRATVLAAGDFDGIRLRDLESGEEHGHRLQGHRVSALTVVRHEGRDIAVGGGEDADGVHFWDPADGNELTAPLTTSGPSNLLAAAVVDGRLMVVTSEGEAVVRAWDPFA